MYSKGQLRKNSSLVALPKDEPEPGLDAAKEDKELDKDDKQEKHFGSMQSRGFTLDDSS